MEGSLVPTRVVGTGENASGESADIATFISGRDTLLGGGLLRSSASLGRGEPGAYKSTLSMQSCMGGPRSGKPLDQFRGILTGLPEFIGDTLSHVRARDQSAGQ